jgi:hypothetical protein
MRISVYLTLAAALPVCATHAMSEPGAHPALASTRAADARSSAVDTTQRLVAVVYLRRDETTGTMRAELHPLAFAEDGEFRDATWPSVEESGDEEPTISMLPASDRQFVMYEKGLEIGRMTVDSVALASYACLQLPVGLGSLQFEAPAGAFGETDPQVDRYRGWVDGESEDYSLRYFIALSGFVPQPEYAADTLTASSATERLRGAITQRGRDTLQRLDLGLLQAEERGRSEPRLEQFRLVDLDRDGVPEAVGRVAMEANLHFDYYEEGATDEYRLKAVVWMRDRGPADSPELLALLADAQSPDSWGDGWELVEVLDLTADGRAEVVYELSGYESNSFHIFMLRDGQLVQAFGGGGHGC